MNLCRNCTLALIALQVFSLITFPQGYYKDVFIDGGVKLTSLTRLPAADLLDLSAEHFASSRYKSSLPPTSQDTLYQNALIIGNEQDLNGVLLYPDGEPRFRLIYVNGGKAANHGTSLGETGRERIREFVANGGSYVGTCAGAFLASSGTIRADTIYLRKSYFQVWPGITRGTGLYNSSTGMKIEKGSPLLKYNNFGGDMYIDSIRHNGGCYVHTDQQYPDGTEILLRYDYPAMIKDKSIDNKISAWAYKSNERAGRVVAIGSHPEAVTSGERLDLMAALIQYGLDGNGKPMIKASLENGKKRNMFKSTSDNNPDSTMIGDKQYHHFKVDIPKNAKNIVISLDGDNAYDLFLFLKKDDFAFKAEADFKDMSVGAEKEFRFETLQAGTWYIGVECNTTVQTVETEWGYAYTGKTGVLNGVPYSILVEWSRL